jgi:hypothetical protein
MISAETPNREREGLLTSRKNEVVSVRPIELARDVFVEDLGKDSQG